MVETAGSGTSDLLRVKIRLGGRECVLPPYPFHLALFVWEAWAIVCSPLHRFRPGFSRSRSDYGSGAQCRDSEKFQRNRFLWGSLGNRPMSIAVPVPTQNIMLPGRLPEYDLHRVNLFPPTT